MLLPLTLPARQQCAWVLSLGLCLADGKAPTMTTTTTTKIKGNIKQNQTWCATAVAAAAAAVNNRRRRRRVRAVQRPVSQPVSHSLNNNYGRHRGTVMRRVYQIRTMLLLYMLLWHTMLYLPMLLSAATIAPL